MLRRTGLIDLSVFVSEAHKAELITSKNFYNSNIL